MSNTIGNPAFLTTDYRGYYEYEGTNFASHTYRTINSNIAQTQAHSDYDEVYNKSFSMSDRGFLFELIERQQWEKIRELLETQCGINAATKPDSSGLSALGMALGFHAPLDIINRLLDIDPEATYRRDVFGAAPIHIACLNGACIEVMNSLICHDNGASLYFEDNDRRVPLHHAVEYACTPRDSSDYSRNSEELLDLVRNLCAVAPNMVRVVDVHGDTPVDLAQVVKAESTNPGDYERAHLVYQILNEVSTKLYAEEKKLCESRHRSVETSMTFNSKDTTATASVGQSDEARSLSNSSYSSFKKKRKKSFLNSSLLHRVKTFRRRQCPTEDAVF